MNFDGLSRFLEPMAILPRGAAAWLSRFRYEIPAARAENTDAFGDSLPSMTVRDGVAVIPVKGVLLRNANSVERLYGAVSHSQVTDWIDQAEDDPNVSGVLFDFDSPGGSVSGTSELGSKIAAMSKPTCGFVDGGLCASACFWLASQCDGIVATPGAQIGGVGAILTALNFADALVAEGVGVEILQSGLYKSAASPLKKMSDSERGLLQDGVNKAGAMFRAAVRAKRPTIQESDMEGQLHIAGEAKSRGFIDGIVSGQSEAAHKIRQPSDENPWVSDFDRKGKRLPNSASSAQTALEAEWARSAELRAEFGTFKVFAAFRSAAARGKAVIRQRGDSTAASRPALQSKQASVSVATAKDYEAQFKASPALQKEFGDVKVYTAFMKASRAGQIKFQRK